MQRYQITLKQIPQDYLELSLEMQAKGYEEIAEGVFEADDYIEHDDQFKAAWVYDSLEEIKFGPRKYTPAEIEFIKNLPPRKPIATPLPIDD